MTCILLISSTFNCTYFIQTSEQLS